MNQGNQQEKKKTPFSFLFGGQYHQSCQNKKILYLFYLVVNTTNHVKKKKILYLFYLLVKTTNHVISWIGTFFFKKK
jgi:hypothetical protein